MRKIFTLFAAMLLAITASATKISITDEAVNSLHSALESTSPVYDTIVLANGTYVENNGGGYITFNHDVLVMAADGASPVIEMYVPAVIGGGSRAEIKGLKFDATHLLQESWYTKYFWANDASANNRLIFDSCEFCNDTINYPVIYCSTSNKLDSLIIRNCYFHNIKQSCVWLENTTQATGVRITNSTFANVLQGSNSIGVIDIRSANASLRVDQCTFYNVQPKSTSYAAIGKISISSAANAIVSNCIFALPTNEGVSNYRAIRDHVTANNCLVYNYTADSNWGMQENVVRNNCINDQDPKFTNAAAGNFSLPDDSPCKGTGVGGTHLGDPRWWYVSWKPAATVDVTSVTLDKKSLAIDVNETAFLHTTVLPADATDPSVNWISKNNAIATVENGAVKGIAAGEVMIIAQAGEKADTCTVTVSAAIPSTDFSTPYFLMGSKAKLDGKIYYNEEDSLYYGDNSTHGTASWQLNVTKPCFIKATVDMHPHASNNGHSLKLYLIDNSTSTKIDSVAETQNSGKVDFDIPGELLIPAAGTYTIQLNNNTAWSHIRVNGITLTATKVVKFKGAWDEWNEHEATVAADGSYASVTLNLGILNESSFGLTLDGDFRANGYGYHRGYTGTADITGNTGNMKLTTDYVGAYTFKWFYANDSMAIVFPEKTLEDGFYLVGTFDGVNAWNVEDLNASKLFEWNTKVDGKDEYKLTVNLAEGDAFKVRAVSKGAFGYIYPDPGDNYVVNGDLAGNVTIYFRPEGNGTDDWHCHVIYCVRNGDPTAIDNTVVGEKAVKFFENGQLFIQKDGKTYNILGTIVK